MDQFTCFVSLSMEDCQKIIHEAAVSGSITGTLIDHYMAGEEGGPRCVVMVYERNYMRVGNRLTLTAVIDNLDGPTRVHCTTGGGGAMFRFDWGAAGSFTARVDEALRPYIIREE